MDRFLLYYHGHGLQVSGQPCLLTPDWDTIPILELVNKIADVVKEERYYIVTDCYANRRSLGELKERLREEHDNQNSQNFPYFKGSLSFRLVQTELHFLSYVNVNSRCHSYMPVSGESWPLKYWRYYF